MAHRRIIHRQDLYDTLAGFLCPVDQHTEIAKIAYPEPLLGTEREHRYYGSRTSP